MEQGSRMHSARGVGARRSENLDAIIDSTLELMLEQGYAAVTYRSVATRAGVAAGLVQYYFSSLDDLFIAVLRRRTDEIIEALTEVTTAEQPLRAVWEYASNRTGTALLMEFMALANHRKAIAGVIGEGGERMRRALLDTLSAKWASYGSSEDDLSPPAALFLMFCIPRMAHLEESLGTFTGHAEAFAWVERFLDRVEPRTRRPRGRRRRGRPRRELDLQTEDMVFLYRTPNQGGSMSVAVTTIRPAIGVEITGMSGSQLVDPRGRRRVPDAARRARRRRVPRGRHRRRRPAGVQPDARHARRPADRRAQVPRDPDDHARPDEDERAAGLVPAGQLPLAHRRRHRRASRRRATLLTAREVDEPAATPSSPPPTPPTTRSPRRRRPRSPTCASCTASPPPRPRPTRTRRRGARVVGPRTDKGAPAGVDAPQRPQVAAARRHRRRGRRLAARTKGRALLDRLLELVDAAAVHAAPPLAAGRPRDLGQHRHAAPCSAVRADLAPPDAPHDARRRGSRHGSNCF